MSRPCREEHPLRPLSCRLCWLCVAPEGHSYRVLWGEPEPPLELADDGRILASAGYSLEQLGAAGAAPERREPCLFLGVVLDKLESSCPARWLRRCEVHGTCTLNQCKTCEDYNPNS